MAVDDENVEIQESEEFIDGVLHIIRRTVSTKVERIAASHTIKTTPVEIPHSDQATTPEPVPSADTVQVPEVMSKPVQEEDAEPLPEPVPEAMPEFLSLSEPLPVVQQETVSADKGNITVQETEEYIDGVRHITRRVISTTVNQENASIEVPPPAPVIQQETVSNTELELMTLPVQIPEPIIEPEAENVNKEHVEIQETEEYIDGVRHVIRRVISTKVREERIPMEVTVPIPEIEPEPEAQPEPVVVSEPVADVPYEYITFSEATTTETSFMHSPEQLPEQLTEPFIQEESESTDTEHIVIRENSEYVNININQEIIYDDVITPEAEVNLENESQPESATHSGNSPPKLLPKCRCVGPSGEIQESVLTDNEDGTYTADITASEPGVHTVNVEYNGKLVPGSPFIVRIMQAPDTKKVRMYGAGLESGLLDNFQDLFHVDTTGAGPGDLRVRVHGPKDCFKVELYRDLPTDRVINVKYSPTQVGIYTVNVYWSGEHVAGSPNELYICENHEQLTKWYDDHDKVREDEGLVNKN